MAAEGCQEGLCDLSNVVAFGHNEQWWPKAAKVATKLNYILLALSCVAAAVALALAAALLTLSGPGHTLLTEKRRPHKRYRYGMMIRKQWEEKFIIPQFLTEF